MKHCRWLLTLMALLLVAGGYSPALADWVLIPEEIISVVQDVPYLQEDPDGDLIIVKVTLFNHSENGIEGTLRLTFNPNDPNFPTPINATLAGEDGSSPTPYFDIVTGQPDLFDSREEAFVEMQFSAADLSDAQKDDLPALLNNYVLQVEVNDESLDNQIFRKKISRTPEFVSGEAAIEVMPVYVKAQSTQGLSYVRDSAGELMVCCEEGEISDECSDCTGLEEDNFAMVKPLIVTFIQEEEDVPFNSVPCYDPDALDGIGAPNDNGKRYAHDVYAAVSLDDGLTWKRKNISRTSTKSSFTLETCNGDLEYPGDSEKQDLVVAGHYAMVTWIDKYCRSGNPWDLTDEEDVYQVTGSQKSVDYLEVKGDEEPRPDLGVRPMSCLWAARGVLDLDPESTNYGTVVWYKAEQLSVGRRDAIRNFTAAVEPIYNDSAGAEPGTGGFAVTWQEDPKGLKTGKGRGPGAGMSGACVNHKTDVWYSYIDWQNFAVVDEAFDPSEGGDDADPLNDSDGHTEYYCPTCPYVYDSEIGDIDNGIAPGTKFIDLPETWICPVDGVTAKAEFIKDAKPHALHHMSSPVPLTDNAVCRDRIPEPINAYVHIDSPHVQEDSTVCDYYYEGGTNNQPLLWKELDNTWECPQCGGTKGETFLPDPVFIKNRNEGGPYCDRFFYNPRVDKDGNYAAPGSDAYIVAYYTLDGEWQDVEGNVLGSTSDAATITEDGTASINGTQVYWSGEPLDGNTGASRPNLSLVNFNNETLALVAYEETKGVGTGSDKEAAAMEQAAPIPLVDMAGDGSSWEAGYTNADCRSCHYLNEVPRDRVIPMDSPETCAGKGGTWVEGLKAYFPYTGYPYITEEAVEELPDEVDTKIPGTESERLVSCVKFFGGRGMYPRDYAQIYPGDNYYALPDHMPGWHQAALNCTGCHLPYNTKDLDQDGVKDRVDLCPGTPSGELASANGCSDTQDPDALDNNKDEPDRFRHGKNIYYHHFTFNEPDGASISHGDQINEANAHGWSEQGDIYENARRVRVVPNEAYDPVNGADVTLGLLYKEGKDGQGAPADAILRLFRNGFDVENMDPVPLNMSSSTPVWFLNPDDAGNEDGSGDNRAGDGSGDLVGNHKTPHIEYHYWTHDNLTDPTGFWLEGDDGAKLFEEDEYTPIIRANPFENVFSTRLNIFGDTIVAGFAHCVNWSAGKNAKDHYDFYVRVSKDSGSTWTLPINVSQLKNHEESVSDCRVTLTPSTIDQEYPAEPGTPADISMNGAPEVFDAGDFNNPNVLFVAVGTKENIPQPAPNETELEEGEVFLDAFYSKATIEGTVGGELGDLDLLFDTFSKENPKYDKEDPTPYPYIDLWGFETYDKTTLHEGVEVPNEPNPAYPEFIDEFDWLAKGDAHQGDVQIISNPQGTALYTIWEQELPIVDDDGQQHFQGADVWFRKLAYPDPAADPIGDVDGNGEVDWEDGRLILRSIGSTAYDADFLWAGDYEPDFRITGRDYNRWKVQFTQDQRGKQRKQWKSK
jgi:rubredoxin